MTIGLLWCIFIHMFFCTLKEFLINLNSKLLEIDKENRTVVVAKLQSLLPFKQKNKVLSG